MNQNLINEVRVSAFRGLDFFVRTQSNFPGSADCGRFTNIANVKTGDPRYFTSNWLTGILASTMLDAWKMTGTEEYLKAANDAIRYIYSLQELAPWRTRTYGAIHEVTPQRDGAHPRDGLSAAIALLDHALLTGNDESMQRAVLFGEWFIKYGMEKGYPYWTIRFDDQPWEPFWHGSFHSGSAYFMARLFKTTGKAEFLTAARQILDFYNANLMDEKGNITVIREHDTMKSLDDRTDLAKAPIGWIMMHKYNDDFGALANMTVGKITGEEVYTQKAMLFLNRMREVQRADGGFGPDCWTDSIPNAAGMILIELMSAKTLGLLDDSYNDMAERSVKYLMNCQVPEDNEFFKGAFNGMTDKYMVDKDYCNARAGAYAVMAMLRFAGEKVTTFTPEI